MSERSRAAAGLHRGGGALGEPATLERPEGSMHEGASPAHKNLSVGGYAHLAGSSSRATVACACSIPGRLTASTVSPRKRIGVKPNESDTGEPRAPCGIPCEPTLPLNTTTRGRCTGTVHPYGGRLAVQRNSSDH
jgi:hypothetical protein